MQIRGLVWDDWNEEHIAKHGVSVFDAEDVVQSYVITARPMSASERKLYRSWRRGR